LLRVFLLVVFIFSASNSDPIRFKTSNPDRDEDGGERMEEEV